MDTHEVDKLHSRSVDALNDLRELREKLRRDREEERHYEQQRSKKRRVDLRALEEKLNININLYHEHMRITEDLKERISEIRNMIAEFEESQGDPFFVVLSILEKGATTLRELCGISGLRSDSVSQYLNRLEKQGKVTRQLDEGKKRGAKYVLTSKASTVPQEMGKPQEMIKAQEMGKAHVDPSNSDQPPAG